jgi:putative protein-disulfide isomerase
LKPTLIYIYDAYCGWCYGFSQVIRKITTEYAGMFNAEILSGGMIRPDKPTHIGIMAPMIAGEYKNVEKKTGVTFGSDFLWHIFNPEDSDWYPDSLKPAVALCILKDHCPERMFEIAADLQYALNYEGRDLTDDEAYRHLLPKYGISEEAFYKELHSPLYEKAALEEFNLVKKLQISGFPAVLLQTADNRIHMITLGYTDYETMQSRMDNALAALR